MKPATSLYLDAVRFGAALLVLLTHLAYARFSAGLLLPLRSFGNDAVMVFFVLSGYVIAHTAATRDRDLTAFALKRCARLYSVAVPALVLTLVLDHCGRALAPALYHGFQYQDAAPLQRILRALSFNHELWFDSWRLFSNGPYWSLGYEFWYYALFACTWYLRGTRRALCLLAVALWVGPKILLLLPVWALGVGVYRINLRHAPRAAWGVTLWFLSLALYALFRAGGGRDALLNWSYTQFGRYFVEHDLHWSNEFLASYVLGALVAMNFIGFHACADHCERWLSRYARPIRAWAGCTFSLYLFHYPLLQFLAAVWPFASPTPLSSALLFVTTVLICRVLASVTEQRKDQLYDLLLGGARWLRRALPTAGPSWR